MKQLTGRASSMPAGLAVGSGCGLTFILVGCGVLAKLIEQEFLAENVLGYGIMIILIVSAFVGASVAVGKIKRRKLLVCVAVGGIIFFMLLSITALFFDGIYDGMGVTALLILCGCGLSFLTILGEKRGGNHRKIKIPNR